MARITENSIVIYTDGSLFPKGRRGGYGAVFVLVNEIGAETILEEHAPPGIKGTTGNRMELQACIDALNLVAKMDELASVNSVVIRTDSRYVSENYKSAIFQWPKQRWRTKDGRPIDNTSLWKEFARAFKKVPKSVKIEWVKGHGKGHKKDPLNQRADRLAKESAKSPLARHQFRSSVRRKQSDRQTKPGCVTVRGQTMIVHIIEAQWLGDHKIWKYRYEVSSPDQDDFNAVDFIYSEAQLRDGHFYEVRVNSNMKFPRIEKVLREVGKDEARALGQ